MDLPILPLPESAAPKAARAVAADDRVIRVAASDLVIDDRFGLAPDEIAVNYADEIAEARADLYLDRPQHGIPLVVADGGGKYAVLTELPLTLAAIAWTARSWTRPLH